MADPMSTVSYTATGLEMFGQYQAGEMAHQQADYNAQLAREMGQYNAQLARTQAEYNARLLESNAQYAADVAKRNSELARNNAIAAEQSAQAARSTAQYRADRLRERNHRLGGAQRARIAKSGVDIEGGTAQDVMYDSAVQGELDALSAIYTGNVTANRFATEARTARYQSEFLRHKGATLLTQGAAQAAATRGIGELRAGAIEYNALSQARMFSYQGNMAQFGSYIGMGTTLLNDVSNSASSAIQMIPMF